MVPWLMLMSLVAFLMVSIILIISFFTSNMEISSYRCWAWTGVTPTEPTLLFQNEANRHRKQDEWREHRQQLLANLAVAEDHWFGP
jgi:hypothetical protein